MESKAGERKSRGWVWLLILALAAGGGWYFWKQRQAKAPSAGGPGGAAGRGMPPASVTGARATRGSIGVYVTGLGAVTPLSTVTVRSRVDGELQQVHYTEGQMIRQGDPLAEIDPRPYEAQLGQLEATLARDRAVLDNAKLDLRRYEELAPKKAVTEQTLATQRAAVVQAEASIKADEAQIAAVRLNISYCHIVAPATGRLGLRLVDRGNYVQAGAATALAVITQVDPISVIFTLTEDQLTQVLRRQGRGGLAVDAYDREQKARLATGRLTTIDNQIDQTTGTVKLRATFDNARGQLFPNQFVNARLLLEQHNGATLLPTAAIQRSGTSAYVYLVRNNPQTAHVQPVKLGVTEGEMTEVLEGVAPGDVVAVHGVDRLQEGGRVQVRIAGEEGTGKAAGGRS